LIFVGQIWAQSFKLNRLIIIRIQGQTFDHVLRADVEARVHTAIGILVIANSIDNNAGRCRQVSAMAVVPTARPNTRSLDARPTD